MNDASNFVHALSSESNLTELDLVLRAAWYLRTTTDQTSISAEDAVGFLKKWSLRPNINITRLKQKLRRSPDVSFQGTGGLHLPAKTITTLNKKYLQLLEAPPPKVENTLLEADSFHSSRHYVIELVRQINGSYQFQLFDCCAVMMRRLAEVLIIDAYTFRSADDLIRDGDGNIKMMNGLLNEIRSGRTFKLSRNAPKFLEDLKLLGDTAAHSRNYITKKRDIDEFSLKFRMLIEELINLS